jgi:hypothetical protein
MDLPLVCPPQTQLQALLEKSLQFERLVRSQKILVEDNLNLTQNEIDHTTKFWKSALDDRDYCWVDVQYLFDGIRDGGGTTVKTWNELEERLASLSLPPVTIWSPDDEDNEVVNVPAGNNKKQKGKKTEQKKHNEGDVETSFV